MLFDPNNKVARPRRDALKEKVKVYKGVPVKSKKTWLFLNAIMVKLMMWLPLQGYEILMFW